MVRLVNKYWIAILNGFTQVKDNAVTKHLKK